ncbi:1-acyl-sn-glycerol-3-phosphate acyltransferase [bacterium]|nr:1-acyl-sn-glycerol-3-phosphate acyltransferase [bacterium]
MFKIPENLPKIDNVFLYCYRSLGKIAAILYIVLGSMVIGFLIFPVIRLFSKDRSDFRAKARRYVSNVFRRFLFMLKITGIVEMRVPEMERLRNIKGKVIVANHPSLLDFVCMTALVPNANCIVRANLTKTPYVGIISQIYITNDENYDDLFKECKEDLDSGNNVLIFPEGTRTPRFKRNIYQKGAARIALNAGCEVQPVFIGGSDKYGLGKHDPLFSFNPVEEYFYDFILLPEIKSSDYAGIHSPAAAKRITDKIEEEILAADAGYRKDNTMCRTFNNV